VLVLINLPNGLAPSKGITNADHWDYKPYLVKSLNTLINTIKIANKQANLALLLSSVSTALLPSTPRSSRSTTLAAL